MSKSRKNQKTKKVLRDKLIYILVFLVLSALTPLLMEDTEEPESTQMPTLSQTVPSEPSAATEPAQTEPDIFTYAGNPFAVIGDNIPAFTDDELTLEPFEYFEELDALGRCGVTWANVCAELMPTEERGEIGSVRPSGWDNNPYEFVDGRYLYNRCHLIGFQLTGENANERNLITGTRYMNVQGMLPFENMVADHVKEEEHHVLYRVTPVFDGENLVAGGVQMEALCVECHLTADTDDDFFFNVYCYNVQPGVEIDYATGANREAVMEFQGEELTYVINTSSGKFHLTDCKNAVNMNPDYRGEMTCTREELIFKGLSPAGCCDP